MSRYGEGYCPNCDERVSAHIEDQGIGPYEFWGANGTHHNYVPVCNTCESPVEDYDEDDYEPEYNEDEFDR